MAARSNPRREPYRGVFVTASPTLKEQVQAAFTKLQVGTASGLCAFGPQTLLKHWSHPFVLQPPVASYNMIGGSAVLLMSLILLIRATQCGWWIAPVRAVMDWFSCTCRSY